MSQVLYRKYRSQDFTQVFGQASVKKVLAEAISQQKISHAYLFTGPRGTGKTSMARILSKSLNCTNRKDANPCNKCPNCVAINEARFMDLIEIDAASNRGIDEIRDLKEKVGFLPVEGTYKVYIIDEVHMLTTEAFNALLKTLEEPPKNVVFVLATTEAHKLPLTIISRTQRFDFKPASDEELKGKLRYILKNEKIKFEDEALDLVVSSAGGSFRDAESLLEKVISSRGYKEDKTINAEDVSSLLGLADHRLVERFFQLVSSKDVERSLGLIQQAQRDGVDFAQFTKQLLYKARIGLMQNIAGEETKYPRKFLFELIKELLVASEKVKTSVIPSLPIELAILNVIGIPRDESVSRVGSDSLPGKSKLNEIKGAITKLSQDTKEMIKEHSKVLETETVVNTENSEGKVESDPGDIDSNLDFDIVSSSWDKLLKNAKRANPHLAAILVKVVLKSCEGGRLQIEVPFKFHQKQLEGGRVNSAFQELAKKVYGYPVALEVSVNGGLVEKVEEEKQVESNVSVIEEVFADLV